MQDRIEMATDSIRISVEGLDAITRAMALAPDRAAKGVARAFTKASNFAAGRIASQLARDTRILRRVFLEGKRIRQSAAADGSRRVWLGYNVINARYAGKLTQYKFGAKAGPYHFKGAFLAPIPDAARPGIFRRVPNSWHRATKGRYIGKLREKITPETVPLPTAPAVMRRVVGETEARLPVLLEQELHYSLWLSK